MVSEIEKNMEAEIKKLKERLLREKCLREGREEALRLMTEGREAADKRVSQLFHILEHLQSSNSNSADIEGGSGLGDRLSPPPKQPKVASHPLHLTSPLVQLNGNADCVSDPLRSTFKSTSAKTAQDPANPASVIHTSGPTSDPTLPNDVDENRPCDQRRCNIHRPANAMRKLPPARREISSESHHVRENSLTDQKEVETVITNALQGMATEPTKIQDLREIIQNLEKKIDLLETSAAQELDMKGQERKAPPVRAGQQNEKVQTLSQHLADSERRRRAADAKIAILNLKLLEAEEKVKASNGSTAVSNPNCDTERLRLELDELSLTSAQLAAEKKAQDAKIQELEEELCSLRMRRNVKTEPGKTATGSETTTTEDTLLSTLGLLLAERDQQIAALTSERNCLKKAHNSKRK